MSGFAVVETFTKDRFTKGTFENRKSDKTYELLNNTIDSQVACRRVYKIFIMKSNTSCLEQVN